jgi:hypothetical protein
MQNKSQESPLQNNVSVYSTEAKNAKRPEGNGVDDARPDMESVMVGRYFEAKEIFQIFNLTPALFGEITSVAGQGLQSGFHAYCMLCTNEVPRFEVHLAKSGDALEKNHG